MNLGADIDNKSPEPSKKSHETPARYCQTTGAHTSAEKWQVARSTALALSSYYGEFPSKHLL
jgi:hypothetical protein